MKTTIEIKRIDPSMPVPSYQTEGSVGFDLYAREQMEIASGEIGLIPSNVIVKTPKPLMLMLAPRSSMPRKKGLMFPHSIGIIDQDYCGPEDEILIQVYNFTKEAITVEKGERIAQAIFVEVKVAEFKEVAMEGQSRGGFGSTEGYA